MRVKSGCISTSVQREQPASSPSVSWQRDSSALENLALWFARADQRPHEMEHMSRLPTRAPLTMLLAAALLGGCAQVRTPSIPSVPGLPEVSAPQPPPPDAPQAAEITVPEPVDQDPMAVFTGDKPLPLAQGAVERIDCLSGKEDLHARIAIEAYGGQVRGFAYYSRWRFQTCSIHLQQHDALVRWRLTEDGATRVQTPHGSFLIRADADNYSFEFLNVERMKYCGMYGSISGIMVVKRKTEPPQCTTNGVLDL
jgi:hypothetical protein